MLQLRAPIYINGSYWHHTIMICIWFPRYMTCPTLLEVQTNRGQAFAAALAVIEDRLKGWKAAVPVAFSIM